MSVAATQPVYPPPPGYPVEADWGAAVAEHVVQRFASPSERDTNWTTPPTGAQCITLDTMTHWEYVSSVWRVTSAMPVGALIMYGGIASPAGGVWLMCDGALYDSAVYPDLYGIIGTRFGGSGGQFAVPPLSDRVPVGASASRGVGAVGGSSVAVLPYHQHGMVHDHYTGGQDTDHAHVVNNHTHRVDLWSNSNGYHNHYASGDPAVNVIGALLNNVQVMDINTQWNGPGIGYYTFTSAGGDHNHAINGDSGGSQPWTAGASASHGHYVNAFNGASAFAGTDATNGNYPPFLAISFLIRAA